MFQDFKELLSIFNAQKVKYLVVGGYAVSLHAQPRATKDLDILVRPDVRNAEAVYAALKKFGAPLSRLKPENLLEKGTFFRMGAPPIMIDIMSKISGVDFDKAWKRRVIVTIDATTRLKAHFISSDDLIAAKSAAGRPQDIADVYALRAVSRKKRAVKPKKRAKKKPAQR